MNHSESIKLAIRKLLSKYQFLYPILNIAFRIRMAIHNSVGKYPFLFYPIYGWGIKHPVRKNTDICIEGFPSSANTFTAHAIYSTNNVKIGHHQHVLAQVKRAKRYDIPTIIIIRRPLDVVTSLISRSPYYDAATLLKHYSHFYRSILDCCSGSFIVARFETILQDFNRIITLLNREFGVTFKKLEDFDLVKNEFFIRAPYGTSPSAEREVLKKTIRAEVIKNERLEEANAIYEKFLSIHPSV